MLRRIAFAERKQAYYYYYLFICKFPVTLKIKWVKVNRTKYEHLMPNFKDLALKKNHDIRENDNIKVFWPRQTDQLNGRSQFLLFNFCIHDLTRPLFCVPTLLIKNIINSIMTTSHACGHVYKITTVPCSLYH